MERGLKMFKKIILLSFILGLLNSGNLVLRSDSRGIGSAIFGGVYILMRLGLFCFLWNRGSEISTKLISDYSEREDRKAETVETQILFIYFLFENALLGYALPNLLFRLPSPRREELFFEFPFVFVLWTAMNAKPMSDFLKGGLLVGLPYISLLAAAFVFHNEGIPFLEMPLRKAAVLILGIFCVELMGNFLVRLRLNKAS